MIYIVGLGAGDIGQIPLKVMVVLKSGKPLYLRTDQHLMIDYLKDNDIKYTSFDSIYESNDRFEDVYQTIVDTLLKLNETQDIIYAVPGHPCVAEFTVKQLMKNSCAKIVGGQSFFDDMFGALNIDPIDGLMVMDALSFNVDNINISMNLIIPQVFDQMTASNLKLDLMEKYDDEHQVCLVSAVGSAKEKLTWTALYEIDFDLELDNLLTLFVPKV